MANPGNKQQNRTAVVWYSVVDCLMAWADVTFLVDMGLGWLLHSADMAQCFHDRVEEWKEQLDDPDARIIGAIACEKKAVRHT